MAVPLSSDSACADGPALWLGVDTGGTFTDFVLYDGQALRVHKVLSTPEAPERAILQGVRELGLDLTRLGIIHGSTVATNAALEGKGVPTVFVTNRGMRDMLTLGRQAREHLYELQPKPVPAPVPRARCLETGGRIGAQGEEIEPLTEADLRTLCAQIRDLAPRSVAINLLFSYLDNRAERAIESALQDFGGGEWFISRSSDVLPEFKEYERGIATWLNAWVGPLVQGYLQRLQEGVSPAALTIMQSSGDTLSADKAGRHAVRLLLSGPAGGLTGAKFIGESAGRSQLLTFDMGGTSTDVAMIDGDLRLSNEGHIGRYPVAVPMVDMHTIGAGGGSIAYLDEGGMLQVGPESAGAAPGPACYGKGGTRPTVTDANLVLGRLRPDAFLGGRMTLDLEAARAAIAPLAKAMAMTIEDVAEGVIRIANEHMARALRVISVQRGLDPRQYTLASFGGAGGLHVCALAEQLGMTQALAPVHAGVLSALGMLTAPRGRQLSRTLTCLLREAGDALVQGLSDLEAQGRQVMVEEGLDTADLEARYSLDLRYRGQSYTLNVPWTGLSETEQGFHQAHQQRYGHDLEEAVELVNLRVSLTGPAPQLRLTQTVDAMIEGGNDPGQAQLYGVKDPIPVRHRGQLQPSEIVRGPLLMVETVSTLFIAPGWQACMDHHGNLLLDRVAATA